MTRVSRHPGGLVAVAACVLLASRVATVGSDGVSRMPHVRTASAEIRGLIRDGCRRSATFRALFDRIEQSDLIVYIETTSTPPPHVSAWLHYGGTSPVNRFLRIVVKVPASDEAIIALVGHELQHATEIAAAPDVRDQCSLDALYRRIGDWSGEGWDSAAARAVTRVVRDELHARPAVERASGRR